MEALTPQYDERITGLAIRTNVLQFLSYTALSASSLIVPIYARELGASLNMIGWIGAAHGLAAVLSEAAFGRLGDRVDRRNLLLIGFLAAATGYTLQAFATTPITLMFVRFLVGFLAGILPATLIAYVYEMRRPLGKFTSYNAFGWLAGSGLIIVGGLLTITRFQPDALESARAAVVAFGVNRALFLSSGVAALLGFFFAAPLPRMRVAMDVPLIPLRILGHNGHIYASFFLRHLGASAIWTLFPLYVLELGGDLAYYGWLHVFNMVAQIAVYRTVERFRWLADPRRLVQIGQFLSLVTFAGYAVATDVAQLVPLQFLVGFSFGFLWLGSLKEILARSPERATASGLLNASVSLSRVAGPLIAGVIGTLFGIRFVMLFGAATTLAGYWAFRAMGRTRAPTPPAPAGPRAVGEITP